MLLKTAIAGFLSISALSFSNAAPTGYRHSQKWKTLDGKPSLVFGHRGEKAIMPEHTLGSYYLAAIEGADYVEPDLTLTKDGHLICNHDLSLSATTDIADHPEFANRKRNLTDVLDGIQTTLTNNWFIEDFTLAELKTLKVRQAKVGVRPLYFDNIFEMPTFEEYLTLVQNLSVRLNRPIGIVPELKHPDHNNKLQSHTPHYFENLVLDTLEKFGYPRHQSQIKNTTHIIRDDNVAVPRGHVVLQNFEVESARYLGQNSDHDVLVLVMANGLALTPKGLDDIATFATYVGPWKEFFYSNMEDILKSKKIEIEQKVVRQHGGYIQPRKLIDQIHKRNLRAVGYTFYDGHEPSQLGCIVKCATFTRSQELGYFFELGMDGVFVEGVSRAIQIRDQFFNLKV
ncbi:PLC-like phosphodiesterase [Basidiobolus meristosporus CBS 931.73]|uniref:glycerophosphodiester phosphodiesterase n=1 Tax=Basidiobolus meristosporus CBS 931.73 TaxID=1314790 RepID=A0A1Y1XZF4_9FUNG|nr:PLC-like phosphodiesterase [Basidiobolus meristosporus CBS 931.73]ORX91143.1 PLC-like phosphodiesterase [Basidiobolus meristosporus CBS 931.73]|eukprot:ORX65551.1 PLC-like phosphodiesterase [Basidiobolus meristosporus CBS 931.73]